METTTKKAALLKAIYERLEQVCEDTLEDVLEMLDIRPSEDEEDIKDALAELENAKVNGTVYWEQYKQELKSWPIKSNLPKVLQNNLKNYQLILENELI